MTARQRPPPTTGKATPSVIPDCRAASARTKLRAANGVGEEDGAPFCQAWPAKPMP